MFLAAMISIVAVVTQIAACSSSGEGAPKLAASGRQSGPGAAFPARARAVASADALVVRALAQPGQADALLNRAATIRQRLWRLEGRKVDALEALEQYGELAGGEGATACQARIDEVLLRTEMNGELETSYEALYALTLRTSDRECASRAGTALHVLAAFQPPAERLSKVSDDASRASDVPVVVDGAAAEASRFVVVKPTVAPVKGARAKITRIERYGAKTSARIVVHLTRPTTFEAGEIAAQSGRGPRVFVDVDSAGYDGAGEFDVGGLVERIRIGKQRGGTRVVLDLNAAAYRHVFYLPEPFRLVIDVSVDMPSPARMPVGPKTVRRVALDPGHGGHDPGAVGPSGLREKDVTLDIAHRAAPLIAQELGISTLLTRDADVFVPLDERTAKANAFGADLFFSIHCNASPDSAARGVMSFVLDESRDPLAAHVAARENAASPAAAAELADALGRVMGGRALAESIHLAELLQRASVASLGPHYAGVRDQGAKRAGFYVLAGARMPAVLYEVAFISNEMEEARLNVSDYRQKLADAIVNAVRAYRDGH